MPGRILSTSREAVFVLACHNITPLYPLHSLLLMNFWCIVDAGQRKNVKHMFSAAIKDVFHFSLIYTSANSL